MWRVGGEEAGKGQTGPGPSVEAAATKELQDKVTWSLKMITLPLCVCVCVCRCVRTCVLLPSVLIAWTLLSLLCGGYPTPTW